MIILFKKVLPKCIMYREDGFVRRLSRRFLFIAFMGIILGICGFSQSQTITVSIPNRSESKGTTVEIPVNITGINVADSILSYQMTLWFDSDVIQCVGATSAGTMTQLWGDPYVGPKTDTVRVGGFTTNQPTKRLVLDAGQLVKLQFLVVGNAGSSSLVRFIDMKLFNINGEKTITNKVNGTLTVVANPNTTSRDIILYPNWNLISFPLVPATSTLPAIFNGVQITFVNAYYSGEGYRTWDRIRYEQGFYNDLQSMDGLHGYFVKSSSGTAQTWHITGNLISVNTPIPLYSKWNQVSYLPLSSDHITHSLQSLDTLYSYVSAWEGGGPKSWDRVRDRQGFYNDLQTLNPLSGYRIKMDSAKTLIYPSGGYSVPKITAPQNIYTIEQDTIIQTLLFCDFYGRQEEFLIEGDTIDVFDSDNIHCGRTFVVSQSRFTVHVFGDDPTTDDIDEGAVEGDTMRFAVNGDSASIKSGDNTWSYMESKYIELGIKASGIFNDRVDDLPSQFSLFQNYPNPFNSQTVISYRILTAGSVTIKIFDAAGRIVNTLIHNRFHKPGQYNILWDGYDEEGKRVSSGIYIYQLRSDTIRLSKKMILLY